MPAAAAAPPGGDYARAFAAAQGRAMLEEQWNPQTATKFRARIAEMQRAEYKDWTWNEFAIYLRRMKRLKGTGNSTMPKMLAHLRFMSEHPWPPSG